MQRTIAGRDTGSGWSVRVHQSEMRRFHDDHRLRAQRQAVDEGGPPVGHVHRVERRLEQLVLSDATEEEAQIKRLMEHAACDVVALIDHSKWGRAAFATFCPATAIQGVVTDDAAPQQMIEELRRSSVVVHVASQARPGDDAVAARS